MTLLSCSVLVRSVSKPLLTSSTELRGVLISVFWKGLLKAVITPCNSVRKAWLVELCWGVFIITFLRRCGIFRILLLLGFSKLCLLKNLPPFHIFSFLGMKLFKMSFLQFLIWSHWWRPPSAASPCYWSWCFPSFRFRLLKEVHRSGNQLRACTVVHSIHWWLLIFPRSFAVFLTS